MRLPGAGARGGTNAGQRPGEGEKADEEAGPSRAVCKKPHCQHPAALGPGYAVLTLASGAFLSSLGKEAGLP